MLPNVHSHRVQDTVTEFLYASPSEKSTPNTPPGHPYSPPSAPLLQPTERSSVEWSVRCVRFHGMLQCAS